MTLARPGLARRAASLRLRGDVSTSWLTLAHNGFDDHACPQTADRRDSTLFRPGLKQRYKFLTRRLQLPSHLLLVLNVPRSSFLVHNRGRLCYAGGTHHGPVVRRPAAR
jgi:hypothetical protein